MRRSQTLSIRWTLCVKPETIRGHPPVPKVIAATIKTSVPIINKLGSIFFNVRLFLFTDNRQVHRLKNFHKGMIRKVDIFPFVVGNFLAFDNFIDVLS